MDMKTLIAKRDAIKSAFDEQTQIKSNAESEQYRLQGEYRIVEEMILKLEESKDGKKK